MIGRLNVNIPILNIKIGAIGYIVKVNNENNIKNKSFNVLFNDAVIIEQIPDSKIRLIKPRH